MYIGKFLSFVGIGAAIAFGIAALCTVGFNWSFALTVLALTGATCWFYLLYLDAVFEKPRG